MDVPQKMLNKTIIWPCWFTPGYIPIGMIPAFKRHTCMSYGNFANFTIAKTWVQLRCHQQISKWAMRCSVVRHLLYKHENLSLNPQHLQENPGMAAAVCKSRAGGVGCTERAEFLEIAGQPS